MKYERLASLNWRSTKYLNIFVYDEGRWHFRLERETQYRIFRRDDHRHSLHVQHGGVRTANGELADATTIVYDRSDDVRELFDHVSHKVRKKSQQKRGDLRREFENRYLKDTV